MMHTDDCLAKQLADQIQAAQLNDMRARFLARFPGVCMTCGGSGMIHTPGVMYYPDGSGEPDSDDPCSCIEGGQCPRCGGTDLEERTGTYEDHWRCTGCGWDSERIAKGQETDFLPPGGYEIYGDDGLCACERARYREMSW